MMDALALLEAQLLEAGWQEATLKVTQYIGVLGYLTWDVRLFVTAPSGDKYITCGSGRSLESAVGQLARIVKSYRDAIENSPMVRPEWDWDEMDEENEREANHAHIIGS